MNKKLGEFLTRKYLEYQLEKGRPIFVREFAEWLGVPPTSYSNWINTGIIPSIRYIDRLADKLGPEVYDVVGLARPAPIPGVDRSGHAEYSIGGGCYHLKQQRYNRIVM